MIDLTNQLQKDIVKSLKYERDFNNVVKNAINWDISQALANSHRLGLDLSTLLNYKIPIDSNTLADIKKFKIGDIECDVVSENDNFNNDLLTIHNKAVNGDFSNGINNWGCNLGTLNVLNNILSITGDGAGEKPYIYQDFLTNDKWFLYTKVRVTNAECTKLDFGNSTCLEGYISIDNPIENQWYELYGFQTSPITSMMYLFNRYVDSATANGKVTEIDGIAGVFAINTTEDNIEHYTEEQLLELVRSGHFNSKSLDKPKVSINTSNNKFMIRMDKTLYPDSAALEAELQSKDVELIFGTTDPITIYEDAPTNAPFPYFAFGSKEITDAGCKTFKGIEVVIEIYGYTKDKDSTQIKILTNRVINSITFILDTTLDIIQNETIVTNFYDDPDHEDLQCVQLTQKIKAWEEI